MRRLDAVTDGRDRAVAAAAALLHFQHRPGPCQPACHAIAEQACLTIEQIPDGPELVEALVRFAEAQDKIQAALAAVDLAEPVAVPVGPTVRGDR